MRLTLISQSFDTVLVISRSCLESLLNITLTLRSQSQTVHLSRTIPAASLLAQCWVVGMACVVLVVPAFGQGLGLAASSSPSNKAATFAVPSFASMAQAALTQDYTIEQVRRFRDANGNIVSVRERLEVDANGTSRPDFAITFMGVQGEPVGSSVSQQWQNAYDRHGSMFFRHGSFHVRDAGKAVGNYTLHDFGQVVRAGRVARRMVVFPGTLDKAIWLVDIDSATKIPLFVAEFDNQLSLCANTEAVSFSASVSSITPTVPSSVVTHVASYAAATVMLGSRTGLIDPDLMVIPDYSLEGLEVHDDPINARQKLVMSYSDGIDQFMVVQTINSLDPFAGMPSNSAGAHTIGRFRDPAVSALVFWDDQVVFHVAGRGSLRRLDDVARRIYLQALSN